MCMPPRGIRIVNMFTLEQFSVTDQTPFVITGTVGEQTVIDLNTLRKNYIMTSGQRIDQNILSWLMKQYRVNNGVVPIIPDTEIINIEESPVYAMQIPVKEKFKVGNILVNDPRVKHGGGDFIISPDTSLKTRYVENGQVFLTTYDMRAFPNLRTEAMKNKGKITRESGLIRKNLII